MMSFTKRWFLKLASALGLSGLPGSSQAASGNTLTPATADLSSFPYELITVTGEKAFEEWMRLRSAGRGWPVVVGGDEDLQILVEGFESNLDHSPQSISDTLKIAETLSVPKDLKAWQIKDGYGELEENLGEWPKVFSPYDLGLSVAIDIRTQKPLERVYIALLPTSRSWEAPAYLRWGGWNACPPPEYHVALLSSWHRQYGAELAGISGDVINLRIEKPVQHKTEALVLAREQYIYCADIVDQGTNDVSTLAATLLGQKWWYFWWD